ncbi:hypothetical protein EIP91_008137 [Steccherinum ochraceum]|uniref:BTB domain-containing protein n=1 Tax=Steccherinum ochraceum TaxID=92696 RepID=A0A4R0RBH5_9APHY|nr:hypothetical protein EIP91_008137 [Steccherinum ochraceum]
MSEAEAVTKPNEPKKHADLWFDDGNIVLVAGDTAFRVYRGVLAKRSEMFHDLFSLPQPEGGEAMDGCSVLRLQESAADMERFLTVLFDGCKMWKEDKYTSWPYTHTIIQMSNKYQIDDLRLEAIDRLKERFPGDIDDWDKLYDRDTNILGKMSDAVSMANAAVLLELPKIHHRALYECCQLSTEKLVLGVVNSDDVRESLSAQDISRCVEARRTLAKVQRKFLSERTSGTPSSHKDDGKCVSARRKLVEAAKEVSDDIEYDPLVPDADFERILEKMCTACAKFYRRKDTKLRQEILDGLPLIFGDEDPESAKGSKKKATSDDDSDSDSAASTTSSGSSR